MLAQPRDAAELQRVRHLVQRDPAQQLVVGRLERARPRARGWARRTAAARACRARAPGTRTGRARARPGSREIAPASTASTPPAERPERAGAAGRAARAAGSSTVAQRREVGVDPARAVDRLGGGHRLRRRRARCTRDEALGLRRGLRELLERRRVAGGLQVATPRATVPASFQSITVPGWQAGLGQTGTLPRRPRPCARARGDHRRVRLEVERRAERVVVAEELDRPPASRTMSCAAAASTARQRFSEAIPSKRRGRDLAQRDRDRADRAQPVGGLLERVDGCDDPARVGGLDPEHLELAVTRCDARRRAGRAARRRARRPRRAARPTPPRARSPARSRTRRRPSSGRRRRRSRARGAAARAWR